MNSQPGTPSILITCEHGGNDVPPDYAAWFAGHEELLETHRGYDPGTLTLSRELAKGLGAKFFYSTVTRLLVDLNRCPTSRSLLSEVTRDRTREEREDLLKGYYHPYRREVRDWIGQEIEAGRQVLHLGIHSFTPELHGKIRRADLGLLYNAAHPLEKKFCDQWHPALAQLLPTATIRRNYPYLGTSDGHTTTLRNHFPADRYAGIELEVNQKWMTQEPRPPVVTQILPSLQAVIASAERTPS
ncbi:MAG: N-formylglutamate amidohydrolase [Pirellulaceae bacterium]